MSKCIVKHKKPVFVLSENKRSVRFINRKRSHIEQARVDGCLICDGKKCDYYVKRDVIVYYVELKGSDNEAAVAQIFATAKFFNNEHAECRRVGVLVSSQIPAIGSNVQRKLKRLIQEGTVKFHDFIIRTHGLEVKMS